MTLHWLKPFLEIYNFVIWWIVSTPVRIFKNTRSFLVTADNALELGANLRLWFAVEPLFGDYNWQGRLVGFVIRSARIITTLMVYLAVLVLGIVAVLAWLALPAYIFILIF